MKIVAISDTHNRHNELIIPECDVLIHCGDCTSSGSYREFIHFLNWLKYIKDRKIAKEILVVAGNHDFIFQDSYYLVKKELTYAGINYLENTGITINDINFWGSPITPTFGNWAFMRNRGNDILQIWKNVPNNTDVLITHGPPMKILDYVPRTGLNVGCYDLGSTVIKIKPKYHLFGHIHPDGGKKIIKGETTYINAAMVNENYECVNKPIEIEI